VALHLASHSNWISLCLDSDTDSSFRELAAASLQNWSSCPWNFSSRGKTDRSCDARTRRKNTGQSNDIQGSCRSTQPMQDAHNWKQQHQFL